MLRENMFLKVVTHNMRIKNVKDAPKSIHTEKKWAWFCFTLTTRCVVIKKYKHKTNLPECVAMIFTHFIAYQSGKNKVSKILPFELDVVFKYTLHEIQNVYKLATLKMKVCLIMLFSFRI